MTTLVAGATGATGQLLVQTLLQRGEHVKAIVRSPDRMPVDARSHPNLSLIQASVLDIGDTELAAHVKDSTAVVSCLGHNLTFKGLFGQPRRLVSEATRRLCQAVKANEGKEPTRFILMNTTGNRNRDLNERISFAQRCVISLLRTLLPPHADNEHAAEFLRSQVGQHDDAIEWVVVRPDNLTNQAAVTDYELHPSPIRSAIFDPGKTSRINVGHFMAELIADPQLWNRWKGRMPVIYNKT